MLEVVGLVPLHWESGSKRVNLAAMAEAHAAVAFSFTVTPEGYDVNINHEAIRAVWESGILSWKKRIGRLKVRVIMKVI